MQHYHAEAERAAEHAQSPVEAAGQLTCPPDKDGTDDTADGPGRTDQRYASCGGLRIQPCAGYRPEEAEERVDTDRSDGKYSFGSEPATKNGGAIAPGARLASLHLPIPILIFIQNWKEPKNP